MCLSHGQTPWSYACVMLGSRNPLGHDKSVSVNFLRRCEMAGTWAVVCTGDVWERARGWRHTLGSQSGCHC